MKIKLLLPLLLLVLTFTDSMAENLGGLNSSYTGELKKQSEINSKNMKWQSEKAQEEEKLRELISQRIWLENRISQYQKYITTLNENIEELQRKKTELARAAEELEPYLDETLSRLSAFIAQDMPFLKTEREARLEFLSASLADYKISAGEKLRRVLEALKVEADYVKGIEVTTEEIAAGGETFTADLFRFGRLGWYYMTPDRKSFGYYSKESGGWVALSEEYKREIIKAAEIAERKRMMELIFLPVSAPKVSYEK